MADKNGQVGEPSPEKYRIESLPGFDAVPRDMQDALENRSAMRAVRDIAAAKSGQRDNSV